MPPKFSSHFTQMDYILVFTLRDEMKMKETETLSLKYQSVLTFLFRNSFRNENGK